MWSEDVCQSVRDARFLNDFLDFVRNVNEFDFASCGETQRFIENLHLLASQRLSVNSRDKDILHMEWSWV
jgi:uncharacterized protein YggL (DUF469 family)